MTEQDKRDRIIAAAYEVLSEKGYDLASTKEIAKAAGVAQGLINYYFPSKDQLFAEVYNREMEKYCRAFDGLRAYKDSTLTLGTIAEILETPKQRAVMEPAWFRLRYELFAMGLRNENAADMLKQVLATKRAHISELVQTITHRPKEEVDRLAAILFSLFEGLGLQKTADPDFDYDGAFEMLTHMLGAYYQATSQAADTNAVAGQSRQDGQDVKGEES